MCVVYVYMCVLYVYVCVCVWLVCVLMEENECCHWVMNLAMIWIFRVYVFVSIQLTIEKMGKAEPTEFGTDFHDLCQEIDKIKASTESILHYTLQVLEPNPGQFKLEMGKYFVSLQKIVL